MKRLVSILLGLSLLVPIAAFAQTDGDKGKRQFHRRDSESQSKTQE